MSRICTEPCSKCLNNSQLVRGEKNISPIPIILCYIITKSDIFYKILFFFVNTHHNINVCLFVAGGATGLVAGGVECREAPGNNIQGSSLPSQLGLLLTRVRVLPSRRTSRLGATANNYAEYSNTYNLTLWAGEFFELKLFDFS